MKKKVKKIRFFDYIRNVMFHNPLTSNINYYPFGMLMPNTNIEPEQVYNATTMVWEDAPADGEENDYRYSFQGQEKDDEVRDLEGGSINYKYRMHDPRVGRFFAVDPIGHEFPWNSPYAFSENIVIHAVELEGKEAFFIHGQNGPSGSCITTGDDVWDIKELEALQNALMPLTNNHTIDDGFDWSKRGTPPPNVQMRTLSALELVGYVLENSVAGEEVTLIGISHGGNVAIQAAHYLGQLGIKVNIITVNTPAENDDSKLENPNSNIGINDMIQIRTAGDKVAGFISGMDGSYEDGPSTHRRQTLLIKNDKWNPGKHATENVDTEQIINSPLQQMKRVPTKNSVENLSPELKETLLKAVDLIKNSSI